MINLGNINISDYMIWIVIPIVIFTTVSWIVFTVSEYIIKRYRKRENDNIKVHPYLRNTMRIEDVGIDDYGEAKDKYLQRDLVVDKIIEYDKNRKNINKKWKFHWINKISVLVFVSSIPENLKDEEVMQMIRLLQVISQLDIDIYYVNDNYVDVEDMVAYLSERQLRCDKILDSEDSIVMKDFEFFDVIFHPAAGLSAAYEILVGVIKRLKEQ